MTTKIQDIAKVCHQVNKAYCEAYGDNTQPAWDQAPDWQKESAIVGVEFALNNPDAPVSSQHDSWMKDKLDNGWKYGVVKDPEAKTHPCLVPFVDLPKEQQAKDYIFKAIVNSLKG